MLRLAASLSLLAVCVAYKLPSAGISLVIIRSTNLTRFCSGRMTDSRVFVPVVLGIDNENSAGGDGNGNLFNHIVILICSFTYFYFFTAIGGSSGEKGMIASSGRSFYKDEAARLRQEAAELELALREEAREKGLPEEVINKLLPIRQEKR